MYQSVLRRSVFVLLLCVFVIATPLARASESTESFSVYTDKEEYVVGEIVSVYVKADAIDPGQNITVTDVVIYDPLNVSVGEWHNLTIVLTDTVTLVYVGSVRAETEGSYRVSAEATGCPWILLAVWWFICRYLRPNVIPEVPVGTIAASITLLAAVGFYLFQRKRLEPAA